jgi:hypothetical protein
VATSLYLWVELHAVAAMLVVTSTAKIISHLELIYNNYYSLSLMNSHHQFEDIDRMWKKWGSKGVYGCRGVTEIN